ncbi:MAG TPA: hypothetical protein PK472_09365, partial [Pseudomonadota bacterium]|nr:hypothetical protein [Pseudomonadota bacterium]
MGTESLGIDAGIVLTAWVGAGLRIAKTGSGSVFVVARAAGSVVGFSVSVGDVADASLGSEAVRAGCDRAALFANTALRAGIGFPMGGLALRRGG